VHLAVGASCFNGDKCIDGETCNATLACTGGKDTCECRVDTDCIPLYEVGPYRDPCTNYQCLVDNTCLNTPYTYCTLVSCPTRVSFDARRQTKGPCSPGGAGCQCGPNNVCATPFECNVTSGYCEAGNPSCVKFTAGCACDDTMACSAPAAGKREVASYVRCDDNFCRIAKSPDPMSMAVPTCAFGSDGCTCRDVSDPSGACDPSLQCVSSGYCTPGCDLGALGCSCHIEGTPQCQGLGVCSAGRCILPQQYCDASTAAPAKPCTLGEQGCCCDSAGACAPTSGSTTPNEDGSVTTVGSACVNDRCSSLAAIVPGTTTARTTSLAPGVTTLPPCTQLTIEDTWLGTHVACRCG
jgi:hypothetical protein